jgi:UDP-N-acetylglucosamine 2-epimerase (non-hydrolysing)
MPEEINRLVTDALADILWTPSQDGDDNLCREGVPKAKVHRVGNIMVDSLEMVREKIEREEVLKNLGIDRRQFAVVTLHRPSNVDAPEMLKKLSEALVDVSVMIPLVFPVHPRTRNNIEKDGLNDLLAKARNLHLLQPLSYRHFMNLVFNCRLAITDSGGIQEETTYLGIPCLTLRSNTERPVTLTQGTNQLCEPEELASKVKNVLSMPEKTVPKIELWDGRTAARVVHSIKEHFGI